MELQTVKKLLYTFSASPAIGIGIGFVCKILRLGAKVSGKIVGGVIGGGLFLFLIFLYLVATSGAKSSKKACLISLFIWVIAMIFMFAGLDYVKP